uniref:PIN domain-containing protein n=1 Tax=Trichocoleus desertorum TaxID=1481672 RepID=UPI0025B2D8F2|nr:PIN domain-containing protein [Trichocoleus desertorum]
MAAPHPILVILDFNALEVGKTREWQEFSRVGECFIPQVVFDEIRYLHDRAPEASLEQTAREFIRFFPDSGWNMTAISATHASLKPASGESFSKKARLSLAVAQAAYGLSRNHPGSLVVLVTTDQSLLQRVQGVEAPNLCGITAAALRQWCRTERQPLAVTQQLRQMATTPVVGAGKVGAGNVSTSLNKSATATTPKSRSHNVVRMSPNPSQRQPTFSNAPGAIAQLFSTLLMLGALVLAGSTAWYLLQPAGFNQFLQKAGLPTLPNQITPPKK